MDSMISGDTRIWEVTVKDRDGAVVSLVGVLAIKYVISESMGSPALISKTLEDEEIVVTDAAAGIMQITVAAADTRGLRGQYYHECELINSQNQVGTIFQRQLKINRDSVRAS